MANGSKLSTPIIRCLISKNLLRSVVSQVFYEGDTLGLRFFHCILQPLTLHMCDGSPCFATIDNFCLVFSAMAKENQTQKKQKPRNPPPKKNKKQQNPTLCHYSPLGCAILCFIVFCFCGFFFFSLLVSCFVLIVFLVSWFLVFWFVVVFLRAGKTTQK